MKEEFLPKENSFNEIKKAMIIKTIPVAILASGVGLTISHFNTNGQTSDINVLPFVIPIIVISLAFGLLKGINRQKDLFESYKLVVNESEIIRKQNNTQTITIPHHEVKSISRSPKGILTVLGNSNHEMIIIPAQINNIDKLEQILSQIKPINNYEQKPFNEKYKGLLIPLMLALMATTYISKNKLIVGISGTILILFLGYSFYEVQKNKNIDKKTKNGMWLLILVVLSILGNMYFKLTGKL